MSEKIPRIEPLDSKEWGRQRNIFVHDTYLREGHMVAFPLCFPGATIPVRADESRMPHHVT